MSPSSTSTRWCPTPEQLMILEELYRRGLRTPNASQIQKITAQLSFYGKIQGKNVFYWFQNHKARDRQKLRKKLAKQMQQQHLFLNVNQFQLLDHTQQNQYINPTHFLDFQHAPNSPPFLQLPNCCSPQNLPPQGSGVCDDQGPEGLMRSQTWMTDLPKDITMRSTYGHDSMMIIDVGPTFPCCRTKPLETLELFPLTASANDRKNNS